MLADITLTVELDADELTVIEGVQQGLSDKEIAARKKLPLARVQAIISSLVLVENLVVATRGRWARWGNFRVAREVGNEEKYGAHLRNAGQRDAQRKASG